MQYYIALMFLIIIWVSAYVMIQKGKKGESFKLRGLPLFEITKEAVGRAAETGKPIMFTTGHSGGGLDSQNAGAHMAGLSMLSYVAEECGKNDVNIIFVPAFPELVVQGENILREAFTRVGKPEFYRTDMVRFYSTNCYSYNLGCITTIRKEHPACVFMIGAWWSSDMLIVGGAGREEGCMQIAGNVEVAGIASSMTVCDYILMGEEVMAAGAFVSKDIPLLNSIVSGDIAKFIWIALMLVGVALTSIGIKFDWITL